MNKFINIYKLVVFKNFYLFVLWFLILLGINVHNDYLNIYKNDYILNWFYFFRAYIQFIITAYLIYKNLDIFKSLKKINYFFVLFFIYNLVQILSLLLSDNSNSNIIYNICALNVLLFLNIIFIKKKYEVKKIFYSLIILFAFIYLYFYFEKIYYLIFYDSIFYGHYTHKSLLLPILSSPRSSGIGRMALLIFLFIIIFFKSDSLKIKIILATLVLPGVIMTQSRTLLGIYLLLFLIISFSKYFNLNNLQNRDLKFNLIFLFILPLIFSLALSQLKLSNFVYVENFINKGLGRETSVPSHDYKIIRNMSPTSLTSNRYEDWVQLTDKTIFIKEVIPFEVVSKKINWRSVIIGNGTQADRFLIQQTASNGLLYIFSSAGIIGILIHLMILIYILKIILSKIKYLQKHKLKDNNYIYSVLIIFTFLLRSLVENSYTVFGTDYLFFIVSLYIIHNERQYKN